jgi:integrative and conjugative element protein (TIGR02256 family)
MAALIWLPEELSAACEADANLHYPLESGGALLGYRVDDQLVVTAMIRGGSGALRTQTSYRPDLDWQNARIAEHYERSGRRDEYLGDWHSHPDTETAYLSSEDRAVLKKIIRATEARCPSPVMAVLAGGPFNWTMSAWSAELRQRWFGSRLMLRPLGVRTYRG